MIRRFAAGDSGNSKNKKCGSEKMYQRGSYNLYQIREQFILVFDIRENLIDDLIKVSLIDY